MLGDAPDAELIADMAISLHSEPDTAQTIDRVLEYALRAVDCDYAGVIFLHRRKNRIETVAATDPLIEALDEIQMSIGQGPDVEAMQDRLSIIVGDIATDRRWPQWAEMVSSKGIRSLLNVRLYTSEEILGTLNLYSNRPGKFDTDDQAVAHVLARHAAVAIASARQQENLVQAADARNLIGQAQGILMERYRIDADQAFGVLVRYSQNANVKLREIAQTLITTGRLPED